nr:MAG TPA: hypothetical protein [Caudoviricetes sp.]
MLTQINYGGNPMTTNIPKFMNFGEFCQWMNSYWQEGFSIERDGNGIPSIVFVDDLTEST